MVLDVEEGGGEVGKEGEGKREQTVLPTVVTGGHCVSLNISYFQ